MQYRSSFLFIIVGGAIAICFSLLITLQCYLNTTTDLNTKADKYADSQFAKLMSIDPFGSNMVVAKAAYWTTEQWTGDDNAYAKARQEVETGSVSSRTLEVQYEAAAENQPKSPLAQFQWGYAVRKRVADMPITGEGGELDSAVFYSLTQADDPHTYNYTRLRYLVSIKSRYLAKLGERLLKRDTEDDSVKAHLVEDYAFDVGASGNPKSKARALALCHQLLQADSKYPNYIAVLGMVYEMSYSYRHNAPDAMAAIVADQKYIRLVDPHSEYAQMKRGAIAEIKADLAKDSQANSQP